MEELDKEQIKMKQKESVRMNEDTMKKIEWLLKFRGDKYDSKSHIMRCAIIKLYKEEKNGY